MKCALVYSLLQHPAVALLDQELVDGVVGGRTRVGIGLHLHDEILPRTLKQVCTR